MSYYGIQDYIFELLGFVIFLNGLFILLARHTIYSVFFLILVFLLGSFLIIFLNADFLGLVYLVVYVGAIAVLFLFVVMMLDLRAIERTGGLPFYLIPALFISLFFVSCIFFFVLFFKEKNTSVLFFDSFAFDVFFKDEKVVDWMSLWFSYFNIEVLGQLIYTHFFLNFFLCGFLLLLGMVGAIILALQPFKRNFNLSKAVVRKNMSEQVLREAHLRFFKKNV